MKKRALTTNTFFGGAAILAASIAVVKVIGALYKIPLGRILGDVGFGHFNNAYAIYNLLLMISQAGLPVAMSKTISEAKTGTFTTPKARRIRELTRYDGKKWIY